MICVGIKGSSRPTKADVARLARVSTATVSYVLNNVEGQSISPTTQGGRGPENRLPAESCGPQPRSGRQRCGAVRRAADRLPTSIGSAPTARQRSRQSQFETDDGRNVVDEIADLKPVTVTSVFPLRGDALAATTAAGIPQIHLGSAPSRTKPARRAGRGWESMPARC
jgi:hypothetical protein